MDVPWLSVGLGDPWWLLLAYVAGMLARAVGLPPLVGFLAAGFLLNAFGAESGELLQQISDLGVTLLLLCLVYSWRGLDSGAPVALGSAAGAGATTFDLTPFEEEHLPRWLTLFAVSGEATLQEEHHAIIAKERHLRMMHAGTLM